MSRGVPVDRPLTYVGKFDPDRTYLPREVAIHEGVPFMSTGRNRGVYPAVAPPVAVAPPAPVSGSLLGYAEVSYTFPDDIPADDTYTEATDVTINATYGNPAIAASGNEMTYSVGGAVGIYAVVARLKLAPSIDTVPHHLYATDGAFTFTLIDAIIDTGDFTAIGRLAFLPRGNVAGQGRLDYEYAAAPLCRWRNTIDTSGVLDVQQCDLYISRFASP